MTENDSFFPFPFGDGDNKEPEKAADTSLPAFPEEPAQAADSSFNDSEIRDLKKIVDLYRQGKLASNPPAETISSAPAQPAPEPAFIAPLPVQPAVKEVADHIGEIISSLMTTDAVEQETKGIFKGILAEIQDQRTRMRAFAALCGIFPIKKSLRHGTPEQRLFALNALGDRYLESMAGLHFNERKKLLKAVARYLSQISDGFNFIQMEGEAFASQYHERVAGASAAGKTVREMHGFLVVGRDSNQVVRIGQVLT